MKARWVLLVVCLASCGNTTSTGGRDVSSDTTAVDGLDAVAEVAPLDGGRDAADSVGCGDGTCAADGDCDTCPEDCPCDGDCVFWEDPVVCCPEDCYGVSCSPECTGSCGDCGGCFMECTDAGECVGPEGGVGWPCTENADCKFGPCLVELGICTIYCNDFWTCQECSPCFGCFYIDDGFPLSSHVCQPPPCGDDICSEVLDETMCTCPEDCGEPCKDKECGDDGCGGTCGECSGPPWECVKGECVCACDPVYQPVCDTETGTNYDNWCEANCAGADQLAQGPCPDLCKEETCVAADYDIGPLCGVDGVTYDNLCELKCNEPYPPGNEDCISFEDCPDIDHLCIPPPPCPGCPNDYNPVCATNGQTYWNHCCFECCGVPYGAEYFCQGECVDQAECPDAPMLCDPVCAFDDNGQAISYINAQVRDCLGGVPLYDAACCDGVSLEEDWVCADMNGTLEAFLNSDVLMCTDIGTPVLYEIPVDDQGMFEVGWCEACQCDLSPAGVAPVCSAEWNTWPNSCVSACEGEEVLCSTPCEACDPP